MAWLLTTPHTYNPGHGKASVTCTHIKACGRFTVHLEEKYCRFMICYGNKVDGEFVPVLGTEDNFFIRNEPDQQGPDEEGKMVTVPGDANFNTLSGMALSVAANELAWDLVAKAIYGYLANLNAAYAGTHD